MLEFKMGNWRTNVSILGIINILDKSEKAYTISGDGQTLIMEKGLLKDFSNMYFKYFIEKYEDTLPWYRISNFDTNTLLSKMENNEFNEDDLKEMNEQIDVVKDFMSRGNYEKIYEYIESDYDISTNVKNLKKVNLRKNEEIQERIEEIETELNTLMDIINYTKKEDSKKYMGAKGVIYSHINRGIEGVSFLNPQTREADIYKDYNDYFVLNLIEYTKEDKSKYKYNCFSCNEPIKNLNTNMNLLKDTGFDNIRKSSHIWNHQSDFAICPKCLFMYTCLPAGFNYMGNEGIFIDYNYNLKDLKGINKQVWDKTEEVREQSRWGISYKTLAMAIEKQYERRIEHEIRDMQIVRYKDGEYRFNYLSKQSLEIIHGSKSDLDGIKDAGYKIGNDYFQLYDVVIERIFNNQNQFSLIHFLLSNLIRDSMASSRYYNSYNISRIININNRFLKGVEKLKTVEIEKITRESRGAGYYLRQAYLINMKDLNRVNNRMKSLTYKMLNALKTNNSGTFMDTLINSYAYVNEPIPMRLVEALNDNERLKIVGYAFVAGINSYDKDNKEDKNEE